MSISTFSSREFNHDVTKAKKAAKNGPVFITDRGKISHVLLAFTEYKKITNKKKNIVDIISMNEDMDFKIPTMNINITPAEY